MSRPSALGTICGEAESAWGEDVTTFATRYPVLDRVDISGLTQEKIEPGRVVQRRNDGTQKISGPMGGSFVTKFFLTGHGSTTAGAMSATSLPTLLGVVHGATSLGPTGTTTTGGTATVPTTTASGTFTAGQLCRIGALGDGRGAGQFYAIATHVTTSLTLLNATPVAASAADVLYSAETVSSVENASSTAVTGHRFLLQTANLQVECHGCWAQSVSYPGLNAGEVPMVEITWGVSWWRFSTATFPSATSVETFHPKPVSAGSLFLNASGTATSALKNIRDFSLDYTLGVAALPGPNGVSSYQTIVGAVRTPDQITVSFSMDADTATASPVLTGYWDGTTDYHLAYTLNPIVGSAMGMYFPRLCATGARPTQMDGEGVNRVKLAFSAYTSSVTTSDLTLAAFKLGFA